MSLDEVFFRWAFWGLFLLAGLMIALAVLTPWRRPGGIPHREHVGFCAIGLVLLGLITTHLHGTGGGMAGMVCVMAAIFLIIGVRSYRAGRAAANSASAGAGA
jgi:hypothetical protein